MNTELETREIIHPAIERHNALPFWKRMIYNIGLGSWLSPLVTLSDVGLNDEEIEELKMMVPFTIDELHKLCHRFLSIDTDRSGSVTFNEFMKMEEFHWCPFKQRLYDVLDASGDQKLTFVEFVKSLSVFSERCTRSEKVKFLFKIYDCDADNRISRSDLRHILSCVLSEAPEHIDTLVDETFNECNANKLGYIDFQKFHEISEQTNIESFMRLIL